MDHVEHYLSRFAQWLDDPATIELSINPDRRIWLLRRGDHAMVDTGEMVDEGLSLKLTNHIAGANHTQTGRNKLLISASVTYNGRPLRAQAVLPPATAGGEPALSFRLFAALPLDQITLDWLYDKPVSLDQKRREKNQALAQLISTGNLMESLRFAVENRMNILISGGTESGKSVALRKIISMIPASDRIITIEDSRELYPDQPNTVALIADRDGTSRTTNQLLEATLRLRPDRIIVGEVRGREAMTFLETINTGHGGSMTTIHAETPRLALDRLAIAASHADIPMSYDNLTAYIRRTIDVIIQSGKTGGRWGIAEIYQIEEEGAQ
ncbi:type II secretion system protein E [Martelella alba]|uniref:Type II secretion system protein E n=1 Tax=Martelella alba TaxID=2590451 RepID=A0A506TY96_9HYPH|nr:ATPase, T2SS/T4P/T4SS family [Martelella alba]TPW27063.1 type II secretion system protein E [Martelella alba]